MTTGTIVDLEAVCRITCDHCHAGVPVVFGVPSWIKGTMGHNDLLKPWWHHPDTPCMARLIRAMNTTTGD